MANSDQPIFQLNKKEKVPSSKIEVIKELIFGDQIEMYDLEFEKLQKDILAKKKSLEKMLDEVKADLDSTLDSISTDINIRITELEKKFENRIENIEADAIDKEMLGKMFTDLGKKLSKKK